MSDNLAVSQPTEPPKVSENLVAAKPEEPPKVIENPDAKADCLRNFRADRIPGIGIVGGIGGGIGGGMTCQSNQCRNGSLIGNGLTGWSPGIIKMCNAGQWHAKLVAAYIRCGIPLPSSLQNLAFSAVLEPCYDQGIPMAIGVVGF